MAESLNSRAHAGQALAITAVRTLFAFLKMSDRLPEFRVKVKHQESSAVPTVRQFLEMRKKIQNSQVDDPRAVNSLTQLAIVETLAGSAVRIGTLLTLRVKHAHIEGLKPYLMISANELVQCKGNSAGAVQISPYAASILWHHIAANNLRPNDLLFDVSESLVRKIIAQVSPEGLALSPHSLRHFACSCLYFKNYDGGRNDVIWVRDQAGHASISTTDNYLKMAKRVISNDAEWSAWANGTELEERVTNNTGLQISA